MKYLTIKEQEVFYALKRLYPIKVDFNCITKTEVAKQLNMDTGNFFRTFKRIAEKGYIEYANNCITYVKKE